jgi:DNA-directed RNA polymerase subunit RPC12/RpoP
MKKVVYICDGCGREYPYLLQAQDAERGILIKICNKNLCRDCYKRVIEFVKLICQKT